MPYPHLLGLLLTATAVFGRPTAAREPHSLQREAESNAAAASATIESVERDLSRMAEFGQEVRRNLNEQATASKDVQHALSYFRRQIELSASERDEAQAHLARLESEVVSLQQRVRTLEQDNGACRSEKATLAAANHKLVRAQASAFEAAQAVEQGLQHTTRAE